jgi:hypothetical protein
MKAFNHTDTGIEKGWEIVGAFDCDPNKFGVDIYKIMETSNEYGVKIQDSKDFELFLQWRNLSSKFYNDNIQKQITRSL